MQNQNLKKEIDTLIERAENGIEKYFYDEESIKKYLDFKAMFYKYSVMNNLLIQLQFPYATAIGSYTFYKNHGFFVKKGEKGIKIRAMCQSKIFIDENGKTKKLSDATPLEKAKIANRELQVLQSKAYCKLETVFDISQTSATAADLPKLFPNKWLDGDVKDYALLERGARKIAEKQHTIILPEPKSELGTSKGCCYPLSNEIALNPRNSQMQNCKTLFHELTHARLHTGKKISEYTDVQRELQAEMTAYIVCQHYGIDTSEYSFKYMKDWTNGKSIENKKQLLNEVSDTAKDFIKTVDDVIEQELEKKQLSNNPDPNNLLEFTQPNDIKKMLKKNNIESSPKLIKKIQKLNYQTGMVHNVDEINALQHNSSFMKNKNNQSLINSICKDFREMELTFTAGER